jgi:hypothetical protein
MLVTGAVEASQAELIAHDPTILSASGHYSGDNVRKLTCINNCVLSCTVCAPNCATAAFATRQHGSKHSTSARKEGDQLLVTFRDSGHIEGPSGVNGPKWGVISV